MLTDDGMWSEEDEDTSPFEGGSGEDSDENEDGGSEEEMEVNESEDEHKYEILTTEQVVEVLFKELGEAQNVIQIPATTLRIILNHFKWDKEKLYESYYSTSDPEKLFKEANVPSPLDRKESAVNIMQSSSLECEICFLSLPESSMAGLECGHLFCTMCWKEYLTTKIVLDGISLSIQCPSSDCHILSDDATVLRLLKNSEHAQKYQLLITNSLVLCNRQMRWCPAPNCNNAVRVSHVAMQLVRCKCSHTFCFTCGEDWHYPIGCAGLRMWMKKCEDDSETANWITVNTKDCPKCQTPIEKNGGCNHMSCKSCKTHFCWQCGKKMEDREYGGNPESHGCNKYKESNSKDQEQEQSRAWLKKYLFYYERYINHQRSLKLENQLDDKIEALMSHGMGWTEAQFLRKAVDTLSECRRTLMYTYVLAFYLKKNTQLELFEDNQSDLENATEILSQYLERDITKELERDIPKEDYLQELKQTVQNKYK